MTRTLIGIVHTRSSEHYTPLALRSLLAHTTLDDRTVAYLIDNDASLDPTSVPSQVTLITNKAPQSYAKNGNIFASLAIDQNRDLILCNNDLIFTQNWLTPLQQNIRGIQIPSSNQQYQYSSDSLKLQMSLNLSDYLGKEQEFDQIAAAHCNRKLGLRLMHSIPYYCVKISQQILKSVGFLDEQFSPFGWEDTDYSVRCYEAGIPVYLNQDSYILHFYGKSTWNIDNEDAKDDSVSALRFEKKWGKTLGDIFGRHTPQGMRLLKAYEERFLTLSYSELVQKQKMR